MSQKKSAYAYAPQSLDMSDAVGDAGLVRLKKTKLDTASMGENVSVFSGQVWVRYIV